MSDLHIDSRMYELPATPTDVDAIIVAGDVADGHHLSVRWLWHHAVTRGLPVIYVLGNHDWYGHDIREDPAELYRQAGVELLHPGRPSIEIQGTRIVGSTLWTNYAIAGDEGSARTWARRSMPDLVSIDLGLRRIGTRDLLDMHRRQRMVIEAELERFSGPTIVVTHHAPHPKSLRSGLFRDPSDGSYASDLSDIITTFDPAVWIHGHVHHSRDYYVSATRVVCNPRGYAVVAKDGRRFENPTFDPGLVVEI